MVFFMFLFALIFLGFPFPPRGRMCAISTYVRLSVCVGGLCAWYMLGPGGAPGASKIMVFAWEVSHKPRFGAPGACTGSPGAIFRAPAGQRRLAEAARRPPESDFGVISVRFEVIFDAFRCFSALVFALRLCKIMIQI